MLLLADFNSSNFNSYGLSNSVTVVKRFEEIWNNLINEKVEEGVYWGKSLGVFLISLE